MCLKNWYSLFLPCTTVYLISFGRMTISNILWSKLLIKHCWSILVDHKSNTTFLYVLDIMGWQSHVTYAEITWRKHWTCTSSSGMWKMNCLGSRIAGQWLSLQIWATLWPQSRIWWRNTRLFYPSFCTMNWQVSKAALSFLLLDIVLLLCVSLIYDSMVVVHRT